MRAAGRRPELELSFLLGFGLFVLFARIPMGTEMLGFLSLLVVLGQRRRAPRPSVLALFFVVALGTSLLGALLSRSSLDSYFVTTVCFALFAYAVLNTGSLDKNLRAAGIGAMSGLLLTFIIALFELATGFKILPMRNPDANTAARIIEDRFVVASIFTNFNDFCIAMALLATLLLATLAFGRGLRPGVKLAMWSSVVCIGGLIAYIGSRGALGALMLAAFLLAVMLVRFTYPRVLSTRVVGALLVVLGGAFYVVWNSPYLQDNSTDTRGVIVERALDMITADPFRFLLGYGSSATWDAAAQLAYPGALMSPHNVFLEYLIAYGVLGPLLLGAIVIVVAWRGFIKQDVATVALSLAAVVTTVLLPVYGAVPSGFIDYGYSYVFPVLAYGCIRLKGSAPRPATADEVGGDHDTHASDDGQAADKHDAGHH